jgi:hypothetical protein
VVDCKAISKHDLVTNVVKAVHGEPQTFTTTSKQIKPMAQIIQHRHLASISAAQLSHQYTPSNPQGNTRLTWQTSLPARRPSSCPRRCRWPLCTPPSPSRRAAPPTYRGRNEPRRQLVNTIADAVRRPRCTRNEATSIAEYDTYNARISSQQATDPQKSTVGQAANRLHDAQNAKLTWVP